MSGTRPPRSEKIGLVPFLFGVAGVEELRGTALTRLLGDLGMTTVAARGQLARMRRAGQLATSRAGRGVTYRLAGPFAESFRLVHPGLRPAPVWSGYFHGLLYQVPETQRAYRDRLRRVAILLGYGILQQGVLIALEDRRDQLAAVLEQRPLGCRVHTATIGMDVEEAAATALHAWDLPSVERALRGHLASLRAALAVDVTPAATAATLRELAGLLNAPFVDLLRDPGLPPALLPPNWPRQPLEAVMTQVADRYLPAASRYAHHMIETY